MVFSRWNNDALFSVSIQELNNNEQLNLGSLKSSIANIMMDIHLDAVDNNDNFCQNRSRFYYLTPSNYLEFLILYVKFLDNY
jgi:hypothetical protein